MNALPTFRRALRYIWPQKRALAMMVVAVLGVTLFYTVSISSILPLLQVMFYQNETLSDWIYRTGAEQRLGLRIQADVSVAEGGATTRPAADQGVEIDAVRAGSVQPARGLSKASLTKGDRIAAVDGQRGGHYELLPVIAAWPQGKPMRVELVRPRTGETWTANVVPREAEWHSPIALRVAGWLPQGRDPQTRFSTLSWVIGGLVVLSILGGICKFCHEFIVGVMVERALLHMRRDIFGHVVRLPMGWFSRQQAGDTMSRVARDSSVLEMGFKILFEKMLSEPLKAAGVFSLSLLLDWRLMVVVIVVLPAAGGMIWVLGNKVKKAQGRALHAWGQVLDLLDERIAGIRILKASHAQKREQLQFFRRARKLFRQQVKIAKADSATSPLLEILGAVAVGGFVLYGGYLVFHGGLDAPRFFTLAACLAGMLAPIRRVANVNNRLQAAESAAARIFELLDLVPETDAPGAVDMPPLRQGIQMRDVTYTYPGADRPALREVSLSIRAGETVALVGPNGSGKTTLSSLLLRFFAPGAGQILFDGVDIGQATLRSLRRQIGLVTQDTVVFTDTIRNNIAYADPRATIEQIEAAAKAARADEFIRLVRGEFGGRESVGYDAVITPRTLSGGQKQRLAIARAVLNNPAILIFDEATSQIDAESERLIQQALAELTRGRTTLIIAHRLSTVINADRIVVLDEGRVAAVGTHQHLLETCEQYRAFCETQLQPAGTPDKVTR